MTAQAYVEKPNGPVAAAVLSGAIGAAALGLATTIAEKVAAVKMALTLSSPVGPLSGKVAVALVAYAIAWIILGVLWRGKEVSFKKVATVAFMLVAVGLISTFPPVYETIANLK